MIDGFDEPEPREPAGPCFPDENFHGDNCSCTVSEADRCPDCGEPGCEACPDEDPGPDDKREGH